MFGYSLLTAGITRMIEVVFIVPRFSPISDAADDIHGTSSSKYHVHSTAGNVKFGHQFLHLAPFVSIMMRDSAYCLTKLWFFSRL